MKKSFVVACIPAYDEAGRVGGVVVRAMKHVDRVVVCDDGSVDLKGAIAEGLGAVVLRHERNRGYDASLLGLRECAEAVCGCGGQAECGWLKGI